MKNRKGFTLVELLITISIIGILSTIGLVLYSTVLKQSRDSKRQSDLKSIQLALEQYANDQGYYPIDLTYLAPATGRKYMNSVPVGSPAYVYVALPSSPACNNSASNFCTSYCLYAQLESPSSSDLKGCPANGSNNFAVTPP